MELPLQCKTCDLEVDLLALLLLVYIQMKTDIQESSTSILTYLEKKNKKNKGAFFLMHISRVLFSLIYWVKAWVGPQ